MPAILDAPGGVLVTSNKRDVVDATRDVRAKAGPVWVFDPQAIALEEPTWWWNPLSYVTDEVKAAKMAEHIGALATTLRTSILLASHDLELVERMCPNVLVLAHGSSLRFAHSVFGARAR